MLRLVAVVGFLCAEATSLHAEALTFDHVKIRRQENPQKRVLVDRVGVLSFDDAARRLSFTNHKSDTFVAGYDDVVKVVFEATTHMRGGWLPVAVSFVGAYGAAASAAITSGRVHESWFYLEYKHGEQTEPVLLDLPKESSAAVIDKATSLFGARVTIPEFQEKGEAIEKNGRIDDNRLPDLPSKHTVTVYKNNHPLPEVMPDKATIVVVCPSVGTLNVGQGNQYKLHANDRVVAVNKFGTYSLAYLDPGKYHLVSQAENADGLEIELEAGKAYYFLQNTFAGTFKGHTALSRNSPELVLYELNGSYFSDWKRN